jgi:hypothetical protein
MKKTAICLASNFIRYETTTKHSMMFMFEKGQVIYYHKVERENPYDQTPDKEFIISHLANDGKFGFPVTLRDFERYFRDLETWRESQLNKILE